MNPKKKTDKGLPEGVCMKEPEAKKGSACSNNPCGMCSESKCVASSANSWGFKCVPTASHTLAIKSRSSGKFLTWVKTCSGRRRRRRCSTRLAWTDQVVGKGMWGYRFQATCKSDVLKVYKRVTSVAACTEKAMKIGGKAVSHKIRGTKRWGQKCIVYKDYCKSAVSGRSYKSYALRDPSQLFTSSPAGNGQVKLQSSPGYPEALCLTVKTFGTFGSFIQAAKCADGDSDQLFDLLQDCKQSGALMSGASTKCVQYDTQHGGIASTRLQQERGLATNVLY